jgi:hypothetical protein
MTGRKGIRLSRAEGIGLKSRNWNQDSSSSANGHLVSCHNMIDERIPYIHYLLIVQLCLKHHTKNSQAPQSKRNTEDIIK